MYCEVTIYLRIVHGVAAAIELKWCSRGHLFSLLHPQACHLSFTATTGAVEIGRVVFEGTDVAGDPVAGALILRR